MVTRTLTLSDDVNALLERIAEATKKSVDEVVSDMARAYARDADDGEYELDDEEEKAIQEGLADLEAGRSVTHDEMMRARRELRGRFGNRAQR